MMKVKILSRKLIKPSTSTPHHLRYFHISFTDEMAPTVNVPLILYYVNSSEIATDINSIKQLLENSLVHVLPQFYLLSGRYNKESRLIDCNDQGVDYLEAQVDCHLHQLLGPGMKPEQLNDLLPCSIGVADEVSDPLLSIQVSMFECGGLAIGICISHRIADASTLSTFLLAWSNACSLKHSRENIIPIFNSPQFFPSRNLPFKFGAGIPRTKDTSNVNHGPKTVVTRRFVFDGNSISEIRSRMMINCDMGMYKHYLTRVQLVSGFILKLLLEIDESKYGRSRDALVLQVVNLREKTSPPIPKHSCGNFYVVSVTQCTQEKTRNMGFQESVTLVGDAVRKTVADCAKILLSGEEDGHMVVINPLKELTEILSKNADLNAISFSSWCRFPYYDADFGWGKPIWVSFVSTPTRNSVVLMDTKDGDGIEAWVTLDETGMSKFQQDQDIRTYTNKY